MAVVADLRREERFWMRRAWSAGRLTLTGAGGGGGCGGGRAAGIPSPELEIGS
jgi:hypothetical protein